MNNAIDNRPVYSLTVTEDNQRITNLMKSFYSEIHLSLPLIPEGSPRIKINGIRGLSNYLEVSIPTAQKLKNSKKFSFYETGNKVYFFSDEVNAGLKVNAKEVGLSKKRQ